MKLSHAVLGKIEIVNLLAVFHGYTSFPEISDYGCGIVRRAHGEDLLGGWRKEWQKARGDPEAAFAFVSRHKTWLLNLQIARDFVKGHECPATRNYLREARHKRITRLFRRLWNG